MMTLYEQIGDQQLKLLLHKFYDRVFASTIIGPLFNQTDAETIKTKQYYFLTQFLGGPPRYNEAYGHPRMRMRHAPHPIDEKAKNEWLKLMQESINELDISAELKVALYNCFPKVAAHMVNS
jgi:hemoglobin